MAVYERVDDTGKTGRRIIGIIREPGKQPLRRAGGNAWQDHVSRAMSIQPEQATPERIARENAEARRHGTGAIYDAQGTCHLPTRGSRAREMRRRKFQDNDAGYSDFGGR